MSVSSGSPARSCCPRSRLFVAGIRQRYAAAGPYAAPVPAARLAGLHRVRSAAGHAAGPGQRSETPWFAFSHSAVTLRRNHGCDAGERNDLLEKAGGVLYHLQSVFTSLLVLIPRVSARSIWENFACAQPVCEILRFFCRELVTGGRQGLSSQNNKRSVPGEWRWSDPKPSREPRPLPPCGGAQSSPASGLLRARIPLRSADTGVSHALADKDRAGVDSSAPPPRSPLPAQQLRLPRSSGCAVRPVLLQPARAQTGLCRAVGFCRSLRVKHSTPARRRTELSHRPSAPCEQLLLLLELRLPPGVRTLLQSAARGSHRPS